MDVIGCGLVVVDEQVFVPHYPQENSKVTASGLRRQVGGPVPTALVMLSRLGRSCGIIGAWGHDPAGQFIARDLRREGIDLSEAVVSERSETGVAQIWVNDLTGTRTVVSVRPRETVRPEHLSRSFIQKASVLHLDGWPVETALAAARIAQEAGLRVVLDAGTLRPGMDELLKYVDILNASERFAQEFCGTTDPEEAGPRLQQAGPRWVSLTHGEAGASLFTRSHSLRQPGFPIVARDTTGAGDVFCGALIHSLLADWPADYGLTFACAAAALKCAGVGNRDALPTLDQITDLAGDVPDEDD